MNEKVPRKVETVPNMGGMGGGMDGGGGMMGGGGKNG